MTSGPEHDRYWDRIAIVLLVAGLILQIWMWSRAWMYYDQILLLQRGMELALDGQLAGYAKNMSGGGVVPGSLLQLMVGLPLLVWFDYRSPALFVGILQLAATLLLWRTLRGAVGSRAAAIFAGLYGLSPWRLYHSGFIWEPGYLLLPAALHLWAALRLQKAPELAGSAVLGASLLLAAQMHPSAFVLLLLTAALWFRSAIRVHFRGFLVGAVVGALPLLPTARALLSGTMPAIVSGGGWSELGLVKVYPVLKAFAYWFRLGSLDAGRRLKQTFFLSSATDGSVLTLLCEAMLIVGSASILLCLIANWNTLARRGRSGEDGASGFLLRYALYAMLALIAASAVSTVTIQSWHTLVVLHAACVPLALWMDHKLRSAGRIWIGVLVAFVLLRVPLALILGTGHPMYRIPDDPKERQRAHPDNLAQIEATDTPFGHGATEER